MSDIGPKKDEEMRSKLAPVTSQQKANPLGAHLLQNYYSGKAKLPIYNLNSPKDIPLILHCAKQEGLSHFGMVVVTGGRHRTPIVIDNDDVYIFESLGTTKSKVGINSAAQIAIAISNSKEANHNIYTFKENRQVDNLSCGSESFIVLKQALNNREYISNFVHSETAQPLTLNNASIIDKEEKDDPFFNRAVTVTQLDNLPPQIAKYSQTIPAIERYPLRSKEISASEKVPGKKETVQEYAMRHLKDIGTPEKPIRANIAVDQRRNKHAKMLTKMTNELALERIRDIVQESSGINLISKHVESIPSDLLEGQPVSGATAKEVVQNYIEDEILKKRDENTGIAPNGRQNLRELATQLKSAPTLRSSAKL